MNSNRIDKLIQYALAVAGQNDDYFDRQLGPIHLIKYAYLADLAYAEHGRGETFTGVKWRFHKFGPWATEVFKRIEPALTMVGVTKTETSHPKYEDDFVRWTLRDDDLVMNLANQLPFQACMAIQNAVRRFGSDTPSLLDYVYMTRPMLTAAPGEFLLFSIEEQGKKSYFHPSAPEKAKLTKKQKEQRAKQLGDLKMRMQAKLAAERKSKKLVKPDPLPCYDNLFFEGQKWLDELAGAPIESRDERVQFSDDVWKSLARFDPDVS